MGNIDEMIKEEWRSLRFYYETDESDNIANWKFYGSRAGLCRFANILDQYVSNEGNDAISEHDHYGPYQYLKIMTWDKPEITKNYIGGTFNDLKFLKNIFTDKLNKTKAGQTFTIGSEYGTTNKGVLEFFVMNNDFDPVSMDEHYNQIK